MYSLVIVTFRKQSNFFAEVLQGEEVNGVGNFPRMEIIGGSVLKLEIQW